MFSIYDEREEGFPLSVVAKQAFLKIITYL
jgi:hypothetical protein